MFHGNAQLSPDEDVLKPEACVLGGPDGGLHAKGAARRHMTPVYRKMHEAELKPTINEQGMQGRRDNKPLKPTTEKWVTTDLEHSRGFRNRGVPADAEEGVAEFQMRKRGFKKHVVDNTVPQREARQNPGKNVFNNERGVRNYGVKGPDNIRNFNREIVKVKKVDPHANGAMKYLSKHKVAAGAAVIAVALEATNIYLAVKADDGEFGPITTIAVSEAGGGLAGGIAGAEIGAAIGSVFPGLGTIIGGFIGGMIGGIAGSLGAGSLAALFFEVPYQPTPQWTELVPFHGDPGFFKPQDVFGRCDCVFEVDPDYLAASDIFTTHQGVLDADNIFK